MIQFSSGGEVMEKVNFFSADYRDGRVIINKKSANAGMYCVHLLNQYYKNDTAARISVFRSENWYLQRMLEAGYINTSTFIKAGEEMLNIFSALPKLKPFDNLNTDREKERIRALFTLENAETIKDYFHRKSAVMNMEEGQILTDNLPPEYDKEIFRSSEKLLSNVKATLFFYDKLADDITKAYKKLCVFVSRLDEAEHFDELHLLPIALEVFGKDIFPLRTEYVSQKQVARRLYFNSFYSFIITDFFEGLHYGHYPRQCQICDRYFLMTSARKQKYCNGYYPHKYKDKKISCKRYAAITNRKERATDDPIIAIYENRYSAIRVEKRRGKITEEFAVMAKTVAVSRKQMAFEDTEYAVKQYEKDMQREKLYADTERMFK